VSASFLRRNEFLHPIAEQEESDPVVVLDGGHRDHGGDLRRDLGLEAAAGPELL
jgi:hypothetical protein